MVFFHGINIFPLAARLLDSRDICWVDLNNFFRGSKFNLQDCPSQTFLKIILEIGPKFGHQYPLVMSE